MIINVCNLIEMVWWGVYVIKRRVDKLIYLCGFA